MKTKLLIISGIAAGFALHADDTWDVSKLDASKLPPASTTQGVTYEKDIKSIFQNSCVKCHGGERHKGGLRLDSREAVLKGGEDGKMVIPNASAKSPLVFAIAQVNNDIAMPPKHRPRSNEHHNEGAAKDG